MIAGLCAGKNLKPYQGLKLDILPCNAENLQAGKNLKPYQMKLTNGHQMQCCGSTESRKKPKTLSGIETNCQ